MKPTCRVLVGPFLCLLAVHSIAASDSDGRTSRQLREVLSGFAAKTDAVNRILDSADVLGLDLDLCVSKVETRRQCGRMTHKLTFGNSNSLKIDADTGTVVRLSVSGTNRPRPEELRYEVTPYEEAAARAEAILATLGVEEDIRDATVYRAHEGFDFLKAWRFCFHHVENGVRCGSIEIQICGDTGRPLSYMNTIILPPKDLKATVTREEAIEIALQYISDNNLDLTPQQMADVDLFYGAKTSGPPVTAESLETSNDTPEDRMEKMDLVLYWVVRFDRDEDDRVAICIDALTGKVLSAD